MIGACPICGSGCHTAIWRAQRQPILLNHLFKTRHEALNATSVDLNFLCCEDCGFVWNAAFDPSTISYGPGYVNDQSQSRIFASHLDDVLVALASDLADIPGDILEIGCGQGEFLTRLCQRSGRHGIGFDPACTKSSSHDGVSIQAQIFSDAQVKELIHSRRRIALIYCRHILEHLANPSCIMQNLARLLQHNGPAGFLYIEVPSFQWIARNAAFFDLFNEHCSLFTADSMHYLLASCGFNSIRIEDAFGGQYLRTFARFGRPFEQVKEHRLGSLQGFGDRFSSQFDEVRDQLHDIVENRDLLLIWGAGAKGISLVNQLGLDHHVVPYLIDINPAKQHRYVALTGQEVIGPLDLRHKIKRHENAAIIVMNPNYVSEVEALLIELQINVHVEAVGGRRRLEVHH